MKGYSIFLFSILILIQINCKQQKVKQQELPARNIPIYSTIGYLEKKEPEFDRLVPPDTKIEVIDSGYTWTEGPVWVPSENCLIFSDVPKNIAYKWTAEKGTQKFLDPSGYSGNLKNQNGSNGLSLDNDGHLILCQSGNRTIAKFKGSFQNPSPEYETIATEYEGKRFNTCNDLVIDKTGNIYFTDPNFGLKQDLKEINFEGVYKINNNGQVQLLTAEWPTPNGIGLSPDEKKLYIANSKPAKLIAYDLGADGTVSNQQILLDLEPFWEKSIAKQRPDGMDVNKEGIIFLTGPDGVFVIQPDGTHLGTIKTDKRTANCTFNEDESTLYITCDELILKVDLK